MGRFKLQWPVKRSVQRSETKSVALGQSDSLGAFMMFGFTRAETASSAMSLYKASTAVSIPINRIAEAFAILDPVIEENGKIIKQHPVLDLLRNPSPYYDNVLFLETIAKHYLITNESELVAIGNINRPPLQLQPISPANVSVVEGNGGLAVSIDVSGNTLAGAYSLETKRNKARYLSGNLKELTQIRGFSTNGNSLLRGQSLLVPAAREARQHILGNDHNVSLLEKGGRLSAVFHFEADLRDDDFQETKDRVRDQYGGASKAGEIGVTAGGKMKINEMGVNNKDMDFAKLQAAVQQSIALQYKFPLPLITVAATTLNNYGESKLALYDDAVLPLADRIFGGLTSFLMPRFGLDPAKTRITYDIDTVTALAVRRNEELKLRKEIGVESDNEFRQLIGREPYVGGDLIYKGANQVPVGSDTDTDDLEPVIVRDQNDSDPE